MIEIKFRAWDKINNKMIFNGVEYALELLYMDVKGKENSLINEPSAEELERFDLMQFTGLQDSKGVDIYCGDIVTYGHEENFEVEYYNERGGFIMSGMETGKLRLFENIECMKSTDFRIDINTIKIVGNIYTNKN